MKKILFVGPLPPPLGGVAIINQNFQNIIYDGYEVISFDTAEKRDREDLYSSFTVKSVFRNLVINKRLLFFIEENKPEVINIFITSGFSILRDLFFLKRMHKYKVPIIIHFHSKTIGEFALTPRRLYWVGKYFNKYANKIILLSEFHYNFFLQYFGKEKCTILENFVNYSDFENNILNKDKEFLFVGRLSKEKGFFDLLHAVKILKDKNILFIIQIIGVAPTVEVDNKIKQFVEDHELSDYFVFNGATFGEKKNSLFKESRSLIFPSHFENSPVVLKEAIAAKMAILSSDIDANKNVLQIRGNYISFQKGVAEDLALKMIELISKPKMVLEMCEISSEIKDYDVSVAKEKLTHLFNDLLASNEK